VAAQLETRFEKGLDQTEGVDMQKLAAEGIGDNARQWLFSRASGIM
jgi:hypothetical protein